MSPAILGTRRQLAREQLFASVATLNDKLDLSLPIEDLEQLHQSHDPTHRELAVFEMTVMVLTTLIDQVPTLASSRARKEA